MKGLFLYGAKCTLSIWDPAKSYLADIQIEYVEYPREITQTSCSISEIARWLYESYQNENFDFILGHSLGGFAALHLVSEFHLDVPKVILVESGPKPGKAFYHNLMTPENMAIHGDRVKRMFDSEACNYNDVLLSSVRDGFDESDLVRSYQGEIHVILGDRGIANYPHKISDLCLDRDVQEKMRFHFVQDACHLPMIENPRQFSAIVRNILLGEEKV